MPVEILEVDGRARHPAVEDRASGIHADFAEDRYSPLEIRSINREGEMVARKLTVVLLKHDHPGDAPGSKEQPPPAFVSKTDR